MHRCEAGSGQGGSTAGVKKKTPRTQGPERFPTLRHSYKDDLRLAAIMAAAITFSVTDMVAQGADPLLDDIALVAAEAVAAIGPFQLGQPAQAVAKRRSFVASNRAAPDAGLKLGLEAIDAKIEIGPALGGGGDAGRKGGDGGKGLGNLFIETLRFALCVSVPSAPFACERAEPVRQRPFTDIHREPATCLGRHRLRLTLHRRHGGCGHRFG